MDSEKEQEKIAKFIRVSLVALSALLLIALGFSYLPQSIPVIFQNSNKKLPIYCVKRDDNKISLSFDAAWAEYWLMEHTITYKNITERYV